MCVRVCAMKKSRTYQTCEHILKELIKQYGPVAKIGWPLLREKIMEWAGGDNRTLHSYRKNLVTLDFIRDEKDDTFTFNIMKVDYKQLGLDGGLVIEDEEPP